MYFCHCCLCTMTVLGAGEGSHRTTTTLGAGEGCPPHPITLWELEKGALLPHWKLEEGMFIPVVFSWVTGAANADTAEVDRVSVQNLIIRENYLQEIRVVQLPPLGNSRRKSSLHAEETMCIDLNKASKQTLIS